MDHQSGDNKAQVSKSFGQKDPEIDEASSPTTCNSSVAMVPSESTIYLKHRRRSLPANVFTEEFSIRDIYSDLGASCSLSKRDISLEDLRKRLPKSFLQLKMNPATTYETKRLQELAEYSERLRAGTPDPFEHLRQCRYLRRSSDPKDILDIDDIFKKD